MVAIQSAHCNGALGNSMLPSSLPRRPLGQQGLFVGAQGLGCMSMCYADAQPSGGEDAESMRVISTASGSGINLLDTADVYGPNDNEELVGRAIRGRRRDFIISTKFGIVFRDGQHICDGSRQHCREACEASLRRLGVDKIDLYSLHRVDPDVPIQETMQEMKDLVQEGKVNYLGLCEPTAEQIRLAHAVHPLTAVMLEWSLWTRDVEEDVVPTCRELGIGIIAYSPLGQGLLAGRYRKREDLAHDDWRRACPRFKEESLAQNVELVQKLQEIAAEKKCNVAQLALAWVHYQGVDVVPIPGTKRLKYLEQNVRAFEIAETLSPEDVAEMEAAIPPGAVVGDSGGFLGFRSNSRLA